MVSLLFCLGVWSYSRGNIGFNGKFCVEGFVNEPGVIRYAYRLVTKEKWSLGAEVPDGGCTHSPLTGQVLSWILYIPHQLLQWIIIYKA